MRLWSASTGHELAAFYCLDQGREWLTVTPAGYVVASPHGADDVYLHYRGQVRPLGPLRRHFERPDRVQRALLAKGAEVNAKNRWGQTALTSAHRARLTAVGRLLRKHRAK